MKVLLLFEKYGLRAYAAGETKDDLEQAARRVVENRLREGYYYTDDDEREAAERAISTNRAVAFLQSRGRCEYETFDVTDLE
jgi:hypothetical protein